MIRLWWRKVQVWPMPVQGGQSSPEQGTVRSRRGSGGAWAPPAQAAFSRTGQAWSIVQLAALFFLTGIWSILQA